jgi:hypothetical protein
LGRKLEGTNEIRKLKIRSRRQKLTWPETTKGEERSTILRYFPVILRNGPFNMSVLVLLMCTWSVVLRHWSFCRELNLYFVESGLPCATNIFKHFYTMGGKKHKFESTKNLNWLKNCNPEYPLHVLVRNTVIKKYLTPLTWISPLSWIKECTLLAGKSNYTYSSISGKACNLWLLKDEVMKLVILSDIRPKVASPLASHRGGKERKEAKT